MGNSNSYIWKLDIEKRLAVIYGVEKWKCARCSKPLKHGELILSRPKRHTIHRKIYHVACWEGMFYDL